MRACMQLLCKGWNPELGFFVVQITASAVLDVSRQERIILKGLCAHVAESTVA